MKTVDKIVIASASLLMLGSGLFLSKFQEGRYFKQDLNKIMAKQESERDYTKLKKKYNITSKMLSEVQQEEEVMAPVENVIDSNPDWENVRAPRKFNK